MQYRKKPVVIEALQYQDTAESMAALSEFTGSELSISYGTPEKPSMTIKTLEGDMLATPGDWIIKGIRGEFYPCKPDIFEATYQPEGPPSTFQQRVIAEKAELDDKISRLRPFLQTPVYAGLPDEEQVRMEEQMEVMASYSAILGERIEAF